MAAEETKHDPLNIRHEYYLEGNTGQNIELKDRFTRLTQLYEQFRFLLNIESLRVEKCEVGAAEYEADFNGIEFGSEITDC